MIQELDYNNSRKYLEYIEKVSLSKCTCLEEISKFLFDWEEATDKTSQYIWVQNDIESPLGFLSYKIYPIPNSKEFLYIVKIYVLSEYRGENPILIDDERVSQLLFREIERKGINIFTLESANSKLDIYYKKLGFIENVEINRILSPIIGKNRKIMARINNKDELLSHTEKILEEISKHEH